jgi:hypothetical protein
MVAGAKPEDIELPRRGERDRAEFMDPAPPAAPGCMSHGMQRPLLHGSPPHRATSLLDPVRPPMSVVVRPNSKYLVFTFNCVFDEVIPLHTLHKLQILSYVGVAPGTFS